MTAEEGGGYLVTFPGLPGCMSDGETIEDAIINAADAENEWIIASVEWDKAPKTRPVQHSFNSGQDEMPVVPYAQN